MRGENGERRHEKATELGKQEVEKAWLKATVLAGTRQHAQRPERPCGSGRVGRAVYVTESSLAKAVRAGQACWVSVLEKR